MLGRARNRDCILYPGKGTVVLIRPAQTFYERIKLRFLGVVAHPHDFTHFAGTLGIHTALGDSATGRGNDTWGPHA